MIKDLLRKIQLDRPGVFHEWVKDLVGVSEETTTGVHRLYQMQRRLAGELGVRGWRLFCEPQAMCPPRPRAPAYPGRRGRAPPE